MDVELESFVGWPVMLKLGTSFSAYKTAGSRSRHIGDILNARTIRALVSLDVLALVQFNQLDDATVLMM